MWSITCMNFKGESRFDTALVVDGGANPPSSNFATVIEGCSTLRVGCSDLSRSSICQSIPKTPMNVGEPWATIGWAANHAGRWTDIPEQSLLLRVVYGAQCRNSGGSGVIVWPNHSVEPAIEKEARLRSQQLTFSRSRMGNSKARCSCEGYSRCPASVSRHFRGAGDPHANAKFAMIRGGLL